MKHETQRKIKYGETKRKGKHITKSGQETAIYYINKTQ